MYDRWLPESNKIRAGADFDPFDTLAREVCNRTLPLVVWVTVVIVGCSLTSVNCFGFRCFFSVFESCRLGYFKRCGCGLGKLIDDVSPSNVGISLWNHLASLVPYS